MSDIYQQHEKAFSQVSAFVICKDGKRVGSIAFKFPRDGAGRLWAYVHAFGVPMVRGYADGYGYDKRSAAASSAAHKINPSDGYPEDAELVSSMKAALEPDNGYDFDRRLRDAGFEVFQAV